jgi:hypothetical protein
MAAASGSGGIDGMDSQLVGDSLEQFKISFDHQAGDFR